MENTHEIDDEIEIDLWEIFYALRTKWWALALALVLGSTLAIVYSKMILVPKYTSTSMVYILSKETTLTSLADLQIGSQLTKDYKVVVTSRPVLQEVIDTLKLDMSYEALKASIVLNNPADTRILSISIEDPDPVRAKAIVDQVASTSSKHISEIMELVPPKIIEEGIVSTQKSSPHVAKNAILGGMVALVLVCGVITMQVIMNDTIRCEDDIEKYLKLSTLAAIPEREAERRAGDKRGKKKRGVK